MEYKEKLIILKAFRELVTNCNRLETIINKTRINLESGSSSIIKVSKNLPSKENYLNKKIANLIELEEEYQKQYLELEMKKEDLIKAFNNLAKTRDCYILTLRYIEGYNWYQVADMIGYNDVYVRELHRKIVNKLEI